MNRRGFFQAIAGAIAGPRLAKYLPPRLRSGEVLTVRMPQRLQIPPSPAYIPQQLGCMPPGSLITVGHKVLFLHQAVFVLTSERTPES